MSTQITTAMTNGYKKNVQHLVQQKTSRLRGMVREESQSAEFDFYDQIGSTTAQKKSSRHADTPLIETPHSRRMVAMEPYEWADLVDKTDKIRTLMNPDSEYAMAGAMAMKRAMDDVIIAAATGTSRTGKTGSTNVALPSGQKVAVAATGLTLAKLLAAKEILDAAENDPDEARFWLLAAKDVTSLLNTTEIKSSDYNTVKALAAGQIDSFLGFKFIRSQRIGTVVGGSDRANIAWIKSGILLAIGQDITTRITERADKSYSVQPFVSMDLGATRMQEEMVVEIAVTP